MPGEASSPEPSLLPAVVGLESQDAVTLLKRARPELHVQPVPTDAMVTMDFRTDLKNSAAANKAFIVNRIGDFAFLLALFIVFRTVTTSPGSRAGACRARPASAPRPRT